MLMLAALIVGLGSALLFSVQPLLGKRLLPLLGGSAGVWNGCMLFFQAVLLAGYLWAHGLGRRGGVAAGLGGHALLLVLAGLSLPLALPAGRVPGVGDAPVPWLIVSLALTVGLPALALAATAPLTQLWFAASRHPRGKDPYFLYAASNVGSFGALLAYPFLVEPRLSLALQERLWSWGWALLAVLLTAFGLLVRRAPGEPVPPTPVDRSIPWSERWVWLGLSALPGGLVLASTQHVTTDIAAVPLLWILPLALYLGTYVVAFSRHGARALAGAERAAPVAIAAALLLMLSLERGSVWLQLGVHLAALGAVGLLCHGRLAARRPAASGLTLFYLVLALGGVLGGASVSLLAPLVFDSTLEYPLFLVAATLLRPGASAGGGARGWLRDVGLAAAVVGVWWGGYELASALDVAGVVLGLDAVGAVALGLTLGALLVASRWPRALPLALAALLVAPSPVAPQGERVHRVRSFYGTHDVWRQRTDAGEFHMFRDGTTIHGVQGRGALAAEPLSYYPRGGPVHDVIESLMARGEPQDIAVVGLGVGAMALHGQPGWRMTFFEMDPTVVDIARDPALFSCLELSPAEIDVVVGDGRLTLAASERRYDLIMLDAFSSDAVPTHLLTVEALAGYRAQLEPGGLILFNVSNAYLSLGQILAAAAERLGLVTLGCAYLIDSELEQRLIFPSLWVLVAGSREELDLGPFDNAWGWLTPLDHVRPWTDDVSSLLDVIGEL